MINASTKVFNFNDHEFWSEVVVTVLVGGLALYVGYRNWCDKKSPSVSQLLIYPIKSCAEMPLQQAKVTARGFEYDRIMQVTHASTKEYCTPRDPQYAKLFHIQPTFLDKDLDTLVLTAPNFQETCQVSLKPSSLSSKSCTPMTGPKVMLEDYGAVVSKWLCQVVGVPTGTLSSTGIGKKYRRWVQVNPDQKEPLPTKNTDKTDQHPVSLADEAPFLLTSTASLRDLNQRLKARGKDPVDMRRFRPNIVISGDGIKPYMEDTWARIRIGGETTGAQFDVWQRCGRCTMTTIHRDSLQRGPEPLATLSTFRERAHGQRNFGIHLIPVDTGTVPIIKVGDKLEVLSYHADRLAEWETLFGSQR